MGVESIFSDKVAETPLEALKEAEAEIRSGAFDEAIIILRKGYVDGPEYRLLHGIMSWEQMAAMLFWANKEID